MIKSLFDIKNTKLSKSIADELREDINKTFRGIKAEVLYLGTKPSQLVISFEHVREADYIEFAYLKTFALNKNLKFDEVRDPVAINCYRYFLIEKVKDQS